MGVDQSNTAKTFEKLSLQTSMVGFFATAVHLESSLNGPNTLPFLVSNTQSDGDFPGTFSSPSSSNCFKPVNRSSRCTFPKIVSSRRYRFKYAGQSRLLEITFASRAPWLPGSGNGRESHLN